MDAKLLRIGACCAVILFLPEGLACAATHTTTNFVVTAPSDEVARKVANCAEFWRRDLAVQWLGEPLPNWYRPCPISVRVGQIGAGGQTTFTFDNGEVFGWKMQVQGSLERILDSVVPHEVNHTIFASHFRRPLPRWADEGAATLFEHDTERARQSRLMNQVVNTSRRIPLKQLLTIREYPDDMQQVLTLYAEGYSLAEYLVGSRGEAGRATYLRFLQDAESQGWARAIERNYGCRSIDDLEQRWSNWVLAGSPEFELPEGQMLAQADEATATHQQAALVKAEEQVIRSQSPQENEVVETLALQPLRSIPRQLRAGRVTTEPTSGQPIRTAELTRADLSNASPYEVRDDSRPRAGEQPIARPSLPPTSLSPTADGIFTNPHSKPYAFPAVRR